MPRFTRSTRDPNRDHLCERNWKNVRGGAGARECRRESSGVSADALSDRKSFA